MFDVAVIGGGHAGVEAATASARLGARTALVTFDRSTIGAMSCNPAIGGIGKGHLVREVDAFDGLIATCADEAAIHYRMLNASKGTAVRGPRVQADRALFRTAVQRVVAACANLVVIEGEATELDVRNARIRGLRLSDGSTLAARHVVIASGTFLNAMMYRGTDVARGGRVDERPAAILGAQLRDFGLPIGRLKTGTPPRIDGRTIDWARLPTQESDRGTWTMSPLGRRTAPQLMCAITRTNAKAHELIRAALHRSPLHSGAIEGRGPRYCPSIEDKVARFGDRDGHQIFLEPEGLTSSLVYPNGISTSLPTDVQDAVIRSIEGLERAEIVQPGYAVEYDFIDPRALDHRLSLNSGGPAGLSFAGQVNGTTGYEEAAAQGLVAGLNAAAAALGRPPVLFDRATSYIGVMVDDLVLQGVTEPYRMLTARSENRLSLRADNAPTRLTASAIEVGCVGKHRKAHFEQWTRDRDRVRAAIGASRIRYGDRLEPVATRLRGEEMDVSEVRSACGMSDVTDDAIREVVDDIRYAPYVERQAREQARLSVEDARPLPRELDFDGISGLSIEMAERLNAARPRTVGDARRLRGITPAALTAIMVHASAS